MSRALRKKARVCYYEPEEPSFDEYVFCTSCGDYVYEYCSIHGPLLVIPDDEVPSPTGYPSFVPRAALNIPRVFLHLAPSTIPDAGIGVFSTVTLPRGARFGPYRGLKTDQASSAYCWQIFDREQKPSHVLDARDPARANWMRYVNCSRHGSEQNLVAFQYQGQLYYRTIRIIPRFTELLVFYGSEFANELNIDLRHYHSPVYTETFVKCADDSLSLADAMQMAETPTVNIDKLQDLKTEEFTPKPNNERHYRHPSECNSLVVALDDSEEVNETADYESRDQHHQSFGTQSLIFNFNLNNENVDSIEPQDTHENYNSNQTLDEKTVYVPQATHTVNNNKIDTKVCPICNVKFTLESDHINHAIKMHNSNIEYKACTICDYKTTESYNLKEHIDRHGYIKQKCPLSEFETASSLKTHHTAAKDRNVNLESEPSLKSNREKPHTCTTCGNKYHTSSNLKRHMTTHNQEREKAHICTVCGNKYHTSSNLKRHMTTHNQEREKAHICTVCGNKYHTSSNLKRHMTTHNQERERAHICTVCKKGFHENYTLKSHMKCHSQQKPHTCTICGNKYHKSSNLKSHMTTHNQEREKAHICTCLGR